jgi:dihydrofolate reductase
MTSKTFKITVHMVSSLDGIIARDDNSISWFNTSDRYEDGVELSKEEIGEFLSGIDCYLMGSHTYEHALELSRSYGWAYGDTPTIVVSSRSLPVERDNVELYAGDLDTLVRERLKPKYKNVWVAGGALLAKNLIRQKLADEISLSIMPIILGGGLLFFDQIGQEQPLHLKKVTPYKNGMVELRYEIRK